jgi:acyl-CoA reductase-like NAD-dependent aldehyde dehydrogenase
LQILAPTATTNGQGSTNPSKSSLHTAPLIINGQDVITTTTFPATYLATGRLYQAGSVSKTDAVSAVEAAQGAFLSWSKTKPVVRRDLLLKAAELFEARKDKLVRYQVEETGAEVSFIDWILPLTINQLKEVAGKTSVVSGVCARVGRGGSECDFV